MPNTITDLKNLIDLATSTSDFAIARTAVRDSDIPHIIKVDFLRQISDKHYNMHMHGPLLHKA